ncbi:MAG: GNAT family N-acetyltransferase [Bacteroidetes bacterium]|nr:MAG: GNAT family N-acetyltransferase [Bacteroidota bacterium]
MAHPDLHIRPVTSPSGWEQARMIRQRVFVEEQACPPEEEWDAYDETSRHVVAWQGAEPVGTARWRAVRYDGRPAAKLERFAVLPAYRGRGYGRRLVEWVMEDARRAGFTTFVLHAQAHLEGFYRSLGFDALDERFMEAGIPHVRMVRQDRVPR